MVYLLGILGRQMIYSKVPRSPSLDIRYSLGRLLVHPHSKGRDYRMDRSDGSDRKAVSN
jgi:hypothetical protein